MSVTKELFGTAKDGREVYAFTLENTNGMKARVINFGANLVDLYVPDAAGNVEDVVLDMMIWKAIIETAVFSARR